MLIFGVYEMHIQPNVMYTVKMDETITCIDNLIESIRNYIGKGRCYTEHDLYYKVKKNEPVWKSNDRYYPYRRDECMVRIHQFQK